MTRKPIQEDAPTNASGGGFIAGIGVGAQGEPGVRPSALANYKRKNAAETPKSPVMKPMQRRMSFADFINKG